MILFRVGKENHNIKLKGVINFKLELHTDRYVDRLGNCFSLDTGQMALESEIAPLESCISYSDYNETFYLNESEVDNLQSEMECNSVDVDVNISSEQEETCKRERGPYRYYSEVQKQTFWQLVIEEGDSAYKAAQALNISLQTASTWKRNWNQRVICELNGIYEEPKKRGVLIETKYLVLDNAAIHKRRDLELLVALSGMELVFLPPYSPELNAIEEF